MANRERVVDIIGEMFAAEVERIQFSEIVGDDSALDDDGEYAVDVAKVAEQVADRLESEGLI